MSEPICANAITGQPFVLTKHAEERFRQRCPGADWSALRRALIDAVPFGGQLGSDQLYLSDQIVFATKRDGAVLVVVSVLTKAQAMANMQSHHSGHGRDSQGKKKPAMRRQRSA